MSDQTDEARIEEERASQWDASDQNLLRATLSATPAQRLAWLEEALELAYQSGALRRRQV